MLQTYLFIRPPSGTVGRLRAGGQETPDDPTGQERGPTAEEIRGRVRTCGGGRDGGGEVRTETSLRTVIVLGSCV